MDSNDIEFIDSGKSLSIGEKVYYFIKAPIIKFVYSQVCCICLFVRRFFKVYYFVYLFFLKIFYALFLMLFSYIMLCDFFPVATEMKDLNLGVGISVPEIILIIWIFLYTIDEIRQVN